MCSACYGYNNVAGTERINFYYAFNLVTYRNVSVDREFTLDELLLIESNVYKVVRVEDVNYVDGSKAHRAVTLTLIGPYENTQS